MLWCLLDTPGEAHDLDDSFEDEADRKARDFTDIVDREMDDDG